MENHIPVEKDSENELPIPTYWRSTFSKIIDAFVEADYLISNGIDGVLPVSQDTSDQIKSYISDYGEVLIRLPKETWETSVCMWMEGHWDVLVDLWTDGEGLSDLVLGAKVFEKENGYEFKIGMVYVP